MDFTSRTKWCNECKKTLSVSLFHPKKGHADEWLETCLDCRGNRKERPSHRRVSERPLKQLALPDPDKWCPSCKQFRPLNVFSFRSDHPGKRKSHCNDCCNAAKKDYKARNREKVHAADLRYYQENKEKVADSQRMYRAAHPDEYRAIRSRWKFENKEAVNASTHRRRAHEKNGGSWTKDDWQRLKATYDWRCLGCSLQEMTDGITLCFDHIIPLSMGGWNLISNGQPLCRSCNSLKHRKVLDLRDRRYPFKK